MALAIAGVCILKGQRMFWSLAKGNRVGSLHWLCTQSSWCRMTKCQDKWKAWPRWQHNCCCFVEWRTANSSTGAKFAVSLLYDIVLLKLILYCCWEALLEGRQANDYVHHSSQQWGLWKCSSRPSAASSVSREARCRSYNVFHLFRHTGNGKRQTILSFVMEPNPSPSAAKSAFPELFSHKATGPSEGFVFPQAAAPAHGTPQLTVPL